MACRVLSYQAHRALERLPELASQEGSDLGVRVSEPFTPEPLQLVVTTATRGL